MKTRLYIRTFQRGWRLILITMLAALTISLALTYITEPIYQASAKFIVIPKPSSTSEKTELNDLSVQSRIILATTFAEIMNSQTIKAKTFESLKLQPGDADKYICQAAVVPNSGVIELVATGPDSQLATMLVNAIGEQTIAYAQQTNQGFEVDFLDKALPATIPISPKPLRDASIAILLGLIVGIILATFQGQLRDSATSYLQRLQVDSATGVYNIRYFSRLTEETLMENADRFLTIGIIELQGLQELFDVLPAEVSALSLKIAIESIKRELRGSDIIGRWDSAMIVVMMQDISAKVAVRIFERIRQRLSEPLHINALDMIIQMNPYIGICEHDGKLTAQELFERADAALSRARQSAGGVSMWMQENPFVTEEGADTQQVS